MTKGISYTSCTFLLSTLDQLIADLDKAAAAGAPVEYLMSNPPKLAVAYGAARVLRSIKQNIEKELVDNG